MFFLRGYNRFSGKTLGELRNKKTLSPFYQRPGVNDERVWEYLALLWQINA